MTLSQRINAFSSLGKRVQSLSPYEKETIKQSAKAENPWFIDKHVDLALSGIQKFLNQEALEKWAAGYLLEPGTPKKVGVAMAGNIPLVGFHDLLCVLVSGHKLHVKLSHQDTYLMKTFISLLIQIEARFTERIEIVDRLNGVDAVIATGSDNTSRYFEYYFRTIPHIIRKNRSSCAILLGEESTDDLVRLGFDVFSYFGMGCRNVSKIFIPEGYAFSELSHAFEYYSYVGQHHKYMNNYDYQKAILILNNTPFHDNGFSIMREDAALVSPLATLYFEHYKDQPDLQRKINLAKEKIQCISSVKGWYDTSVDFGETQFPVISDYADNIDTLKFLSNV
jgi:hypothetical protein